MPADVAQAIVTERSGELVRHAYLGYAGILRVLNDIRKTIPILSRVHSSEFGYMLVDLNKYHRRLRDVATQLGVTTRKIKELGETARQAGVREEDVRQIYGQFRQIGLQKFFGFAELRRYRQTRTMITLMGAKGEEQEPTPENIQRVVGRHYLQAKLRGDDPEAARRLGLLPRWNLATPQQALTIARMAEQGETPEGRAYRGMLQVKGQRYNERTEEAVGGINLKQSIQNLRALKEESEGAFDPATTAKLELFDRALNSLGDTLVKLRKRYAEILASVNVGFWTKVITVIDNLGKTILRAADYVEALAKKFPLLFNLPFAGLVRWAVVILAKFALWSAIPLIFTAITAKTWMAAGAIGALGRTSMRWLPLMFSPLHMILLILGPLVKGFVALGRAALMLNFAPVAASMGASIGIFAKFGHVVSVTAIKVWGLVAAKMALLAEFALGLAVIAAAALWIDRIVVLVSKLLDLIRDGKADWSDFWTKTGPLDWMLEKTRGVFSKMAGMFRGTSLNMQSEIDKVDKAIEKLGKTGENSAYDINTAMRTVGEEDLFGDLLQQIINLPERVVPRLMTLIEAQYGRGVMPQMLGIWERGKAGAIDVSITLKDPSQHVIHDLVETVY